MVACLLANFEDVEKVYAHRWRKAVDFVRRETGFFAAFENQ